MEAVAAGAGVADYAVEVGVADTGARQVARVSVAVEMGAGCSQGEADALGSVDAAVEVADVERPALAHEGDVVDCKLGPHASVDRNAFGVSP